MEDENVVSDYVNNNEDRQEPYYIHDFSVANFFRNSKYVMMKKGEYSNRAFKMYLNSAMHEDDVFTPYHNRNIKYYIKKFLGFSDEGYYIYQIKRLDKANISSVDIERFFKGENILLIGAYYNKL